MLGPVRPLSSTNSCFKAGAAVGDWLGHTEHGKDKGNGKGGAVESNLMLLRGVSFLRKALGDQTLVLAPRPGDVRLQRQGLLVLGKE